MYLYVGSSPSISMVV